MAILILLMIIAIGETLCHSMLALLRFGAAKVWYDDAMHDDVCSTLAQVLFLNHPITITAYSDDPHLSTLTALRTAATSACPQ
ncbi:MAG: hypothetical protein LCH85_23955 [Chloroflexi bacterium]|nr:hypothetical protein [Chloroflexota bacterium]